MKTLSQTQQISRIWQLDSRSLALGRVLLAICLIVDVLVRWPHLYLFYSDEGASPWPLIRDNFLYPGGWTIHPYFPSAGAQMMLAGLEIFIYFMMMIGWRTRLFQILAYLMLLSVQHRNPIVMHGGDQLIRVMMFWALFLPLGEHFSVDARRKKGQGSLPARVWRIENLAALAMVLQICYLYLFGALLKDGAGWIPRGSALHYAFHLDELTKPLGHWLLTHLPYRLLQLTTYAVWALEISLPLMILIPFRKFILRRMALGLGSLLHIMFWLCLLVGPFPLYNIVALIILQPSSTWDIIYRRLGKAPAVPEIIATVNTGPGKKWRELRDGIIVLLIVQMTAQNLSRLSWYPLQVPPPISYWAYAIGQDEDWHLFAPEPPHTDGWTSLEATLADGKKVELLASDGRAPYDKKPKDLYRVPTNYKDQKYIRRLVEMDNMVPFRKAFVEALVRRWNERHGPEEWVSHVNMYYYEEMSPPPGSLKAAPPERRELLNLSIINKTAP